MTVSASSYSIETGYFIFTLMPSLFCKLRCPHCYLSLEQRKDRTILSLEDIRLACEKIDAFYAKRGIEKKTIVNYWYGGEPTSMGEDYFTAMVGVIDDVFRSENGYTSKHTVLSSLIGVDPSWYGIFHRLGGGEVQSSFDGEMRGASYVRQWEQKAREAVSAGLRLSTISVVNRALIQQGPEQVLDYLSDIGVAETSWLPFMLNDQNKATGKYAEFAPSMAEWSEFMIAITQRWMERRRAGLPVPEIGQLRFIMHQRTLPPASNVAGQTLFLMPNGDLTLPDYRNGHQEFMLPFGNILTQSFEEVLYSPARRLYLRKQHLRNGNPTCRSCPHAGHCVMEFWKDNREGDDCFGGRRYVEWVLANADAIQSILGASRTILY
jgi:sulfatase maturation enzyme AslB (radical SAM superfamily)